ncbi:D-glycero-beta-D-manno-heptose 1,7-bisphosphate 7-phosphatase [Paraglaciecola sp.]|uniref:D-glycero-beta-D-manno-heptose 1,7-bisphosphate 7-phosphatase n=1 Tax=Paraglaciecola sp. TaxID=1920173 RepID=UPI003EF67F15
MNKAFFLDRDGVINEDNHYVHKVEQFKFVSGVFEACRLIQAKGYKIIIVTNQSGIGRGYYDENAFSILTDWMLNEFEKEQVNITAVYFCPHHSAAGIGEYKKDCECRKPNSGMLVKAANDHQLNLSQSSLVGDRLSDIKAGTRAGLKSLYLISDDEAQLAQGNCNTAQSLLDAVQHYFK